MPSPFPGMDPYLESPAHWPDFHHEFISAMREQLQSRLPTNYYARINELVMMITPDLPPPKGASPDVLVVRSPARGSGAAAAVADLDLEPETLINLEYLDPHKEAFIEVVRLPGQEVVTVIELFSPTNKSGDGRSFYLEKRHHLLHQSVNLVEIDLIRAGKRPQLSGPIRRGHYHALISRADRRPACEVYSWTVRQPLPKLPIPLRAPDADSQIDLQAALRTAYDRGHYERMICYSDVPPRPIFDDEHVQWIAERARTMVTDG